MPVAPTILDSSGQPIAGVSESTLAAVATVLLDFSAIEGQVYVIKAAAQGSASGGDQIEIAPVVVASATATPITLSSTGYAAVAGTIASPGDSVLYRFTATASGLMALSQQASEGTPLFSLTSVYDASMNLIQTDDDSGGNRDSQIELRVTSGQTYFVRAQGYQSRTGDFTLTLATDSSGHDFATATPLLLDATNSCASPRPSPGTETSTFSSFPWVRPARSPSRSIPMETCSTR